MNQFKKLSKHQVFWPIVILLVIILMNGLLSQGAFFKITVVDGHLFGRIIDILRNGSRLMLLAVGMTMVLATGGTDISVGSVMAMSGAVSCSILYGNRLSFLQGNFIAAIVIAIIVGVLCGAWNGFLVAKMKIQPIVATMILLVAGRGIAQLITDGKIISVSSKPFYFINGGYLFGLPFPIYIVLAVALLVMFFVKGTAFGLFLEATGINSVSSHFAGINTTTITWMVYMFSGAMAAIAGLVESSGIKCADVNNSGQFIELDAILAVAIGGTSLNGGKFSIGASIAGALIIQSITTTVLALGVAPQVTQVLKAIIVLAICLFQADEFKKKISSIFQIGKAV